MVLAMVTSVPYCYTTNSGSIANRVLTNKHWEGNTGNNRKQKTIDVAVVANDYN